MTTQSTSPDRYNRAKYVWRVLLIAVVGGFFVFLASLLGDPGLTIIVEIAAVAATAPIAVKRLHDLDKSGWYYLLVLVPLVNLILGLCLLFVPGTRGSNEYGPDPLGRVRSGNDDTSVSGTEGAAGDEFDNAID